MIPFKVDPATKYTDTDSIFTTKKLPDSLIGKDLGLMKDELNGCIISEAYFLGVKQYGYYYYDKNNDRVEKSVWAGVTRDSLSFEEIKQLFKGELINKVIDTRFFKSLINLSVEVKSTKTTIEFKPHKSLVDNIYLPAYIYSSNYKPSLINKFISYIKKMYRFINKYLNY